MIIDGVGATPKTEVRTTPKTEVRTTRKTIEFNGKTYDAEQLKYALDHHEFPPLEAKYAMQVYQKEFCTGVEKANDGDKARPAEERQANAGAKKAEFDAINQQLTAAAFGGDKDKIDAALKKLDEFKKANPDFKPEEQPENKAKGPMKFAKVKTVNSKYYTIDIYENGKAIYSPNVPTEKEKVRSKKEIRAEVKKNAKYNDKDDLVSDKLKDKDGNVKGEKNLEKARAEVKAKREKSTKELDKLTKDYNNARKEYYNLRKKGASEAELAKAEAKYKALGKKMGDTVKNVQDSSEAYVESNRALKTARGNGTRKISRKERNIQKSENKVAERSHVYLTKAEENQALDKNKAIKGHSDHLDKTGADMLQDLQMLAMRRLEDSGIKLNKDGTGIAEGQKFTDAQLEVVQKWGDIVQIQIPDPKDDAATVEKKTRSTQKALKALAGMDNTIDPTEKKTIIDELKIVNSDRYSGLKWKGLRTELNKLYNTYGLENRQRSRYKFMDAGKGLAGNAVPAMAAGTLAYFKDLSVTAKTLIKESTTIINNVHVDPVDIDMCVEDFATAVAHAEASTPGFSFTYLDPETQEEILKRVAGQYDEQTVEAVAHAIAEIHIHREGSDTSTSETYTSEKEGDPYSEKIKIRDWKKALTTAGTVLAVGAAIDFLTSKGKEHGVGSDAEEYKDAQFINMHKGVSAKAEAQKILELRDELTKKMGGTKEAHAQANQMVVDLYKQADGVQNGVMKMEELTGVRVALADMVKNYDKAKPVKPNPPEQNPPAPNPPAPNPNDEDNNNVNNNNNDKYCYDTKEGAVVKPNSHTVKRGETVSTILRAKYPGVKYADALKAFLAANPGLKDPNSIAVGQEFVLPDIGDIKPDMKAAVRTVKGGKRIQYRPSKTGAVQGRQTYDVVDCSDPKNLKVLSSGHSKEEAQAEVDRRSKEAQNRKK